MAKAAKEGIIVLEAGTERVVLLAKIKIYTSKRKTEKGVTENRQAVIRVPVALAEKFAGEIVKITIEKVQLGNGFLN